MIHITRKRAFVCIGLGITLIAVSFMPAKAQSGNVQASTYGEELRGNRTASGEVFDPNALTAASRTIPLGTWVEVCADDCETVKVNDIGPAAWTGKDLDLSTAAAEAVGLNGVGSVQVSRLGSPTTEAPEAPKEKPKVLPKTGGIGQ